MLKHRRGDLYLGELVISGEKNLQLNCDDLMLKPIRGIKITLEKSRHFVISKKYPNSKNIFQALEKGLQIL